MSISVFTRTSQFQVFQVLGVGNRFVYVLADLAGNLHSEVYEFASIAIIAGFRGDHEE